MQCRLGDGTRRQTVNVIIVAGIPAGLGLVVRPVCLLVKDRNFSQKVRSALITGTLQFGSPNMPENTSAGIALYGVRLVGRPGRQWSDLQAYFGAEVVITEGGGVGDIDHMGVVRCDVALA